VPRTVSAAEVNDVVGDFLHECGLAHRAPLVDPGFPGGTGYWDRVLDETKAKHVERGRMLRLEQDLLMRPNHIEPSLFSNQLPPGFWRDWGLE
jgi:hypothetical protein